MVFVLQTQEATTPSNNNPADDADDGSYENDCAFLSEF